MTRPTPAEAAAARQTAHEAQPTLRFRVDGTPAPQGSKRAYVPRGTTRAVVVDDNKGPLRTWRLAVTSAARDACGDRPPLHGPVALHVDFYLLRPTSHYRAGVRYLELRDSAPRVPANGPDLDKLARAVSDALTDAGAYEDDRQVQRLAAQKRYTDRGRGTTPGAWITVGPA